MNVACTACPAKYAVPDERVRGKRARITCKHCGTSIIVDGTSLGPSDGGSVVAPRPARKTMLGMGQAASSALSSPTASVPSNAPPSGGTAWLVALADGRREPASQARIVDLYAAGTIDASTYIWREGMPEWKTPFTIPEVAAALTARGLQPRQASVVPQSEQDPEEATKVAISVLDNPALARARSAAPAEPSAAPAATSARKSDRPPPEDDVTIARSGPPSSPVSLPPLRAPSDRPPARSLSPSATRTATPSAEPPARRPSEPPVALPPLAAPTGGRRPRAHTLPGDLVIPLTGPAAPPPTPLFAPRGQPFRRPTPGGMPAASAPPTQSAMVAPSAAVQASAPPTSSAPPPPPPAPAPIASPPPPPPAPSLPLAELMVAAPSAVNLPAPARPAEFEVPPRSAAPVSVPLEFTQSPERRRRTALFAALAVLAVGGVGFGAYWKASHAPKAGAVAAVPAATTAAPAPTPSAAETAAPTASAEAAPAPSAEPAEEEVRKPSARERASSAARAAARPAPARKAEATKTESSAEGDSEPTAAATESETEAPARDEGPKKPEPGAGTTPFDRDAASEALSDAAMRAVSCRMLGGPTGSAQATVTFAPNGHVSGVSVGGDFAGSVVGACIGKLFRAASVPPFAGDPVTVAKRFTVE